jgi:hypothetical protein
MSQIRTVFFNFAFIDIPFDATPTPKTTQHEIPYFNIPALGTRLLPSRAGSSHLQ